jgi:predicted Zn-dependent protease
MFAFRNWIRKGTLPLLVAGMSATAAACGISQQQELQLGQQYASQINRELPIVNDAAASRYMNQLGRSIAQRGGRNIEYTFYIVNSNMVNAFAVPGGYIYVNRGLIEATGNMAELAGVLAHEIGHVEERHSVEQLEKAQGANLGLTLAYVLLGRQPSGAERAAINVGGGLYFASHSRQAENEADAVAVSLLAASSIDPNGLVTMFQKLLAERKNRPSQFEQWFATHPLTEDRIANVRQLIQRVPPAQLRGAQTNTTAFQSFKAGLRRYPAPPPQAQASR